MRNMDLPKIDLNLLVALDVLLEEQHVTRSAKRLNVSQSSMSRTLARLRATFEDQLLVSTPQGYAKTPRAIELEIGLKETLHALQSTFSRRVFDPKTANNTFKVSTLDYGEAVILPQLTQILQNSAPSTKLEISHRDMHSVADLQSGAVDVTIGIMPYGSTEGCLFQKLFEDRYVCAMCVNHPLAKQELTLEGFSAYGHSINMSSGKEATPIDDVIMELNIDRKIVRRSSYFFAALFALGNTDLLHPAGQIQLDILVKDGRLTFKELPFEVKPIELFLIWHVRNDEDPSHKWFRERIIEAAETLKNVHGL